jgi:hypothetical protein
VLISLTKSFKKLHNLPRQNAMRYADSDARPILFPSPAKMKAHLQNIGFWASCMDGMEMVPNANITAFNRFLEVDQPNMVQRIEAINQGKEAINQGKGKRKLDLMECGGMKEITSLGMRNPPSKKARSSGA